MEPRIIAWIAVGISGGIAGSYIGSSRLKPLQLKYLLASVLFLASIKLILL